VKPLTSTDNHVVRRMIYGEDVCSRPDRLSLQEVSLVESNFDLLCTWYTVS
jgi:hypothetical protein